MFCLMSLKYILIVAVWSSDLLVKSSGPSLLVCGKDVRSSPLKNVDQCAFSIPVFTQKVTFFVSLSLCFTCW